MITAGRPSRYNTLVQASTFVVVWVAAVLGASSAGAAPSVTAKLVAAGAHASGTATFAPRGGGTGATVVLRGLAPGAIARGLLHAGTCARPGASFAALPVLRANESGIARASGPVLFHGTVAVSLLAVADGRHVVRIVAAGRVVACGAVPKLR